jgi:hypothetical protein
MDRQGMNFHRAKLSARMMMACAPYGGELVQAFAGTRPSLERSPGLQALQISAAELLTGDDCLRALVRSPVS